MKVLITGGLGYVGGRIATEWKSIFPEAHLILTTQRNQHPQWAQNFDVVHLQLADPNSIKNCLKEVQPDAIIHLAAMDQVQCRNDSDLAQRVNVEATRILLGPKLFGIMLSSLFIYRRFKFMGIVLERLQSNH